MTKAYYITAAELAVKGSGHVPPELLTASHLVYSSPATLAFNSPGAQGFGVKRAGLAIPGSVMLLAAPRCCGRNTTALGNSAEYADRFFYYLMDDTDIVTGRHLLKLPEAVKEVCECCRTRPSVVMICITCADALLGTDMERVCRKCSDAAHVPVVPCYMYALTREGRVPPMAAVRKTVYSLLEKRPKESDMVNLLGCFSPLDENCELFTLLRQAGVRKINEISRQKTFDEYLAMAGANFNIVLHPEARYAALDLEKRLNIPYIELARLHHPEKIHRQYTLFAQSIGVNLDDARFYDEAQDAVAQLKKKYGKLAFSVGEWLNADAFELSLSLLRSGFAVPEIFGTVGEGNFVYVKRIAELSPETRIYSNLSPSMIAYQNAEVRSGFCIGRDAMYYHPDRPGIPWNAEEQSFGYRAVTALFREIGNALQKKEVHA